MKFNILAVFIITLFGCQQKRRVSGASEEVAAGNTTPNPKISQENFAPPKELPDNKIGLREIDKSKVTVVTVGKAYELMRPKLYVNLVEAGTDEKFLDSYKRMKSSFDSPNRFAASCLFLYGQGALSTAISRGVPLAPNDPLLQMARDLDQVLNKMENLPDAPEYNEIVIEFAHLLSVRNQGICPQSSESMERGMAVEILGTMRKRLTLIPGWKDPSIQR